MAATAVSATAEHTTSLPNTRTSSPIPFSRHSTPPPASKPIPEDFRSSLAAWWNNASYKEARFAEERLLRRMEIFRPSPPEPAKGWFGWSTSQPVVKPTHEDDVRAEARGPVTGSGLVATLRNVFVPTPNPDAAPGHPADPVVSGSSPASSLSEKSKHRLSLHKKNQGKLVDYINTMEISSPDNEKSKEAVVVLHGYAAAMGFFFRNWESIAQTGSESGRRTFFLDWLGMGLSSRPSPNLLSSPSSATIPNRVSRAEHFFLSSLESWRESVGVDKMVLVGHSLGGYLASAYAVRYPDRVSGLILVSPAGVPHGPDYKRYPTSEEGNLDEAVNAANAELNQGQREAKGEAKEWQKSREESATRKYMMKFFVWSWEKGVSPFAFLRNMGPWGPMFAARYTQRRFSAQSEEDRRDIHAYIYNTSILKGSGEYCISHLLAPGAYARIPIVDRINKVKVPVTFMYGDNDWMDVDGGHASVAELKKAGNHQGQVHVVPKAGHHLYLDNPEVTNRLISDAIKALPKISQAAQ
ncbi:Alpha/Beta hydrolase protein [Papiliotrema laurentii]|uniref:Alpha/Beta hydrolase protein n=1 Tax=Papiliotrema laurentii TaxID=5418 RepID=A0AAD9CYD4_PAPLA|nr:Alpha/Beta hydrolase protein [Papiliotrema laurentii]